MTERDGFRVFEWQDLHMIPERKPDANKGSCGHALIIAGSEGMSGAAYLSALAAYRTGAGLVRILTPEANRVVLQTGLPEAIVSTYLPEEITEERESWQKRVAELMEWSDAVVLGPGLGRADYVKQLVEDVLGAAFVPVILDADALNTVAEYPYLTGFYTENIIITPHVGEMARLTGKTVAEILESRRETAESYRDTFGVNVVLKSDRTVTALTDGSIYLTLSGTPALAKAGTGDVLTGVIAGLICIGMEEGDAAAFGSFLHGLAGRKASAGLSVHGVLAREVADALPAVMRQPEY